MNLYPSAAAWRGAQRRSVALIGMSGVGKTSVAQMLRAEGNWFHYSVDYRIGTRYLGEQIVDGFKREAMRNPRLRELLMTDSIYIASNITFENLAPLSAWLGKPGDAEKHGLPFDEYLRRQRLHREAEIAALADAAEFRDKAEGIYGHRNFLCDTGGSICEVSDPDDPNDPVLTRLSEIALPLHIRETDKMAAELRRRFSAAPKPMYYQEEFLRNVWRDYLEEKGVTEATADPDDFIRWGFARLLDHRRPRYEAIGRNWGVSVEAAEIAALRSAEEFDALVTRALERKDADPGP